VKKYKGILILPIILSFYFIVGTLEYKLEMKEFEYELEAMKLNPQIEAVKALHNDIEDKLEIMRLELEELKPDENNPLNYKLQIHLKNECEKYGVDINEAIAIMTVENPTFNPKLTNKNSNGTVDTGLLQINSCHANNFNDMGFTDMKDPYQNISYGVYFISILNKYEGEMKYMAYNMGEGGMQKAVSRGIYSTRYSRKVKANLGR